MQRAEDPVEDVAKDDEKVVCDVGRDHLLDRRKQASERVTMPVSYIFDE